MDSAPALRPGAPSGRFLRGLLLCTVFVVATCGLVYELVAGTLASYLLGDSVTQFSTIIGAYLFSMGLGSWLSGYLEGRLLAWFISIEVLVGIIGGLSAPLLFVLFEQVASFRILLYGLVGLTGILVGLEIPLMMRILKDNYAFKDLVSRIFTFDYIGALLASIVFPLLLVPYLGLIRTSLFFGLMNVAVAAYVLYQLGAAIRIRRRLTVAILLSAALLGGCFVYADSIQRWSEGMAYADKVIYSRSTPYQRIVLTRGQQELRLFLNGNLQFSSKDEYRYHEALVHPAMQGAAHPGQVLVLGGGDGLALRELLKYPQVEHIRLVDLDPAMTQLFRSNALLTALNGNSFASPKVAVTNADAFRYVLQTDERYDVIVIDFPDPSGFSVGKLYTRSFYEALQRILTDDGVIVVQSTSPYVARKSFWCVAHTVAAAGFNVIPYHAYVPSFGEWGYVMGTKNKAWRMNGRLPAGLRFLNPKVLSDMLLFPPDMAEVPTDTSRLNNQVLVHYFEQEWGPYSQ